MNGYIDSSELYKFEMDAKTLCQTMGEDPYITVEQGTGMWVTNWQMRAAKMFELAETIKLLRHSGHI